MQYAAREASVHRCFDDRFFPQESERLKTIQLAKAVPCSE